MTSDHSTRMFVAILVHFLLSLLWRIPCGRQYFFWTADWRWNVFAPGIATDFERKLEVVSHTLSGPGRVSERCMFISHDLREEEDGIDRADCPAYSKHHLQMEDFPDLSS